MSIIKPDNAILRKLKDGDIESWNNWVKSQREKGNTILIEELNLSEIIFSENVKKSKSEDLKSENFPQIDFFGCILKNCKFSKNIMSVNFNYSTIENCTFEKNHFVCSTFTEINFTEGKNSTFTANEYVATNINLETIANCPKSLSNDYTRNIIKNIDDCNSLARYGSYFYRKKEDIKTGPLEEFFKEINLPKINLPDFGFRRGQINEFEVNSPVKYFPSVKGLTFPTVSWYTPSLSLGLIESGAGFGPKFHVNFMTDYSQQPIYGAEKNNGVAFSLIEIGFGYINKNRNIGFYLGPGLSHYSDETAFDFNGAAVNAKYRVNFLNPTISGGFDLEAGPLVLSGKFSYDPKKIEYSHSIDNSSPNSSLINVESEVPFLANLGANLTFHEGFRDKNSSLLSLLMPREIGFGITLQGEHSVKIDIPNAGIKTQQEITTSIAPSIRLNWSIDGKGPGWRK